ncbi:MAG TPA: DUF1697 domain-containing protein [Bryobacteraceae bacterium]|nr:DUF1697 domain-containing protein [Bryobacteraceae bacterium]
MRYVALLRGIGPTNPNMKGERLKAVLEEIGFKNVHPVIASGNIIFDAPSTNRRTLETKIEKALPEKLGFTSTTVVRTKEELEALVKRNPFRGVKDEKPNYLLVTFFKDRKPELCTVIEIIPGKVPDFMRDVERRHGKAITSRTWKTIGRILKKMEQTKAREFLADDGARRCC